MTPRENDIIQDFANSEKQKLESKKIGYEKGDICNRDGCLGIMREEQDPCYCLAINNPPCSACEHSDLVCDICDFSLNEDGDE